MLAAMSPRTPEVNAHMSAAMHTYCSLSADLERTRRCACLLSAAGVPLRMPVLRLPPHSNDP